MPEQSDRAAPRAPVEIRPRTIPRLLLGAAIGLASGCTALAEPVLKQASIAGDQAGAVTEGRARELETLVRQDCGSCHGMTLKGGLGPDIRPETLAGISPETITRIILDGVPGTPMPPWRPLISEDDARWIALYLTEGTAR